MKTKRTNRQATFFTDAEWTFIIEAATVEALDPAVYIRTSAVKAARIIRNSNLVSLSNGGNGDE